MAPNFAPTSGYQAKGHGAPLSHSSQKRMRAVIRAEAICRAQGARLTPIRRKVFEALCAVDKPLGAYELADRLSPAGGRRLAPITVYRALDFLIEQGLAYRLASLNAYIPSLNGGERQEAAALLVCESCGLVEEVTSQDLSLEVSNLLKQEGFRLKSKVLEVAGHCAHCQRSAH
jgi:Fur family transcriptional regulator, zinc uptake regulator